MLAIKVHPVHVLVVGWSGVALAFSAMMSSKSRLRVGISLQSLVSSFPR
jgi:hypothetical protein